jgi:uncharacterized membrane protein
MSFVLALVTAVLTCHSIKNGAGAFPDTYEFARGSSCWSSSVACGLGRLDGMDGIMWGCALSASGVVFWVARMSGLRGLFYLAISCLTPFGWSLLGSGADSLGALAVIIALGSRYRALFGLCVCAFHLAAGLSLLASLFARRIGVVVATPYLFILSAFGEAFVRWAVARSKASNIPKVVYVSS